MMDHLKHHSYKKRTYSEYSMFDLNKESNEIVAHQKRERLPL